MKIDIDIPDTQATVYIIAGSNLVARKFNNRDWEVIETLCNKCGKCCMNVAYDWPHGKINNNCQYLYYESGNKEWLCRLGADRPFNCCISDESHRSYCSMKWKKR